MINKLYQFIVSFTTRKINFFITRDIFSLMTFECPYTIITVENSIQMQVTENGKRIRALYHGR